MRVDDISAYLRANGVDTRFPSVNKLTSANKVTDEELKSMSSSEFATMLTKEINAYSEMNSLSGVLNKSVLSSFTDSMDLSQLSEDLLGTKGGREVITKLCEGQLNSIIFTDNSNNEDNNSMLSSVGSLDSYQSAVKDTSTLTDLIERYVNVVSNKKQGE